jgi:very-short-patch-repair endonuclease
MKTGRGKYCSRKCYLENIKNYPSIRECQVCHKDFITRKNKYCSKECYWKSKKNMTYKEIGRQPVSPETRTKMRMHKILHPDRKFCNTSIEQKIAKELERRGYKRNLDFYQNKGLAKICNVDFYLPEYKVVIECDGCRYHACKQCGYIKYFQDAITKDKRKTKMLEKKGFVVYRFWEHEINRSPEECINRVRLK